MFYIKSRVGSLKVSLVLGNLVYIVFHLLTKATFCMSHSSTNRAGLISPRLGPGFRLKIFRMVQLFNGKMAKSILLPL